MGPVVRVEDLSKRYGTTQALDGVSFEVHPGEMVAVLGPSGAGKTTLLRCLNGSVTPDAGTVEVNGERIDLLAASGLRRARRRIGLVYQQFNLVGRLSVLTNVLSSRLFEAPGYRWLRFGFTPQEVQLAFRCLARVDLLDRAYQRADTLSGGQQQRVALARAMCQEPALMLADEPVASLDPRLADRILGYLAEVNRSDGVPTIVNLHTVDLARRFATRVLGVNSGRIVVDVPATALADPQLLRRIYDGATEDEEELELASAG
ncbi:MAG: phosphonate ABC transporter ATP-binding protein [Chloroflexi bacterium]|nr:phosphonate ABC transporter ATP-binding protein [Chloroflexota bacterium]